MVNKIKYPQKFDRIIPPREVAAMFNRSPKSIWRWVKEGNFPCGITLNGRTIGWRESTIDYFLDTGEVA